MAGKAEKQEVWMSASLYSLSVKRAETLRGRVTQRANGLGKKE